MNWNGQQGGYGNGYPQQGGYGQQEDVYNRLDGAKEIGGARFPFIEDGRHRLALVLLEEYQSTKGVCARAIFKVLESQKHQPGSYVTKIWQLQKPERFPNSATDSDKFADFCRKLKGAPAGHPIGANIRTLMKDRVNEQLARGTVIDAVGVANKKGNWVEVYWNTVEGQAPDAIVAMRQRLEQEGIPDTGSKRPQQPMQQGYQQQPMQQMQPPMQPQYNSQYGGQPMQNPQPQFQQPPMQPQYGQPQGAPQGGFLAQLPPPNGGQQGGNGGGW